MRKEKLRKVGLCFINGCFIKSVNMIIKGTLMQISKSPYMFVLIYKQYPENFTFLILRIFELFTVKFVNFFKSRLLFNIFYCF